MASLVKRNKNYYLQYYVAGKLKRFTLKTSNYQIAKARLAQFQLKQTQGQHDDLVPTKTPISEVLSRYVRHIRTYKTPKSAQTDVYYLRQAFGAVCSELEITSRKVSQKTQKKPPKTKDRRKKSKVIEANCFEEIKTATISEFVSEQVRIKGLAPKTANRHREILVRIFNWAMTEGGVSIPDRRNPAAQVRRYQEKAPEIRFLTIKQIQEQLDVLKEYPQMQTMIAMYIYSGLRREELLWLQMEDINLKAGQYGMIRIRAKTVDEEYWQPKTKKNRAVPISSDLRRYLDNYAPRISVGGWFFPSPKGFRYDPDNFSSDFARIQKKIGLRWSCLDFRHTFGSQLASAGVSLYKISTLMGNSPEICRKHYAVLIPEALGDCVEFNNKIYHYCPIIS